MQLTLHTDYALRLMIQLAMRAPQRLTLEEVARAYGISKNHLTKVAQTLTEHGLIRSVRGRGGGLELACDPETVTAGAVVRMTEENLNLVECFSSQRNTCPITPACRLKQTLGRALNAFLDELDKVTLADLAEPRGELMALLAHHTKQAESPPSDSRVSKA